mgnify:CR=1 FL=1
MKVSLNGYAESVTSFEADANVKAGFPVKLTGNGKVGVCTAKEPFCGIALNVRNGFAAVQLPYSGSGVKVGYLKLGAANGKVEVADSGRECLVTDVDTESATCGVIL